MLKSSLHDANFFFYTNPPVLKTTVIEKKCDSMYCILDNIFEKYNVHPKNSKKVTPFEKQGKKK